MPLLLVLVAAAAQAQNCEQRYSSEQLVGSLDRAEAAYLSVAVDDFLFATDEMRAHVDCSADEIPKPIAARLWRYEGMRRSIDGDIDGAKAAFASARSIEPGYRFPTALVPDGHPMNDEYAAVDISVVRATVVKPPALGRVQLNGELSLQRPEHWPVLVQHITDAGEIRRTARLDPGEPWLNYTPAADGAKGKWLYDQQRRLDPTAPLLVGAGAAAIASVVVYGAALNTRGQLKSADTRLDDLEGIRSEANALGAASLALGGVAVGVGIMGVAF